MTRWSRRTRRRSCPAPGGREHHAAETNAAWTRPTTWRDRRPEPRVALADVLNALDPCPTRCASPCLVVLPITGPVGPVPSF